MKTTSLFLLLGLLLTAGCGQDAASKEAETRVVASIQQLLGSSNPAYVNVLHTWYQSDVPNTVKLNPKTESVYRVHAEILQEVTTNEPRLVKHTAVTPAQVESIRAKYKQLVAESAARVQELSNLATSGTSMSEAEQLTYVSGLADKQTRHLALVRYYTKRTAAAIALKEQKLKQQKYNREMWGHE